MAKTTTNDVRVIEGWARPGGFSPTGVKCLYDSNFKGEQVECSMVIGDKAMPMSRVEAMVREIIEELAVSKADESEALIIAAKYGVKL